VRLTVGSTRQRTRQRIRQRICPAHPPRATIGSMPRPLRGVFRYNPKKALKLSRARSVGARFLFIVLKTGNEECYEDPSYHGHDHP
jgi:hypothetical protein